MHIYILRRLLLLIPTLFGVTIVVFAVMALSPGGISSQSLVDGVDLEPQAKQALKEYYDRLYGLDQPAPIQYLRWLNNILPFGVTFDADGAADGFSLFKGSDLGRSFRFGRPVSDLIAERVPITLLLNLLSIPLIYVVAISIGVRAAVERGRPFDVGSSIVMLGLWSAPTMLVGVLLIGFFANDQYWRWFPTAGLNERAAFDMAFLPHWSAIGDVLLLFGALAIAALGAIALARWNPTRERVIGCAALGAGAGAWVASGLDGASIVAYLGFALVFGALVAAIGALDFTGLRVALLGLIALAIGGVVGAEIGQGTVVRGFLVDRLWHLALPVFCLTYGGFAFLSKLTRTAVLENLSADYARTARAKGVAEREVIWRHVFRNSLLPLITVAASLLPALLGGSVIVESLFSIEGMGKLAIEAVQTRDRELVLSITLIGGLLTLAGNLIADICYAIADPRVSYD